MGNNHIMDILGNYMEMLERENDSLKGLISAKHIKRNEDSNLIAELKAEINDLNVENCNLINESKWDKNKMIKELQAEIKTLKQNNHYKKNLTTEIETLQAEIKELKKSIDYEIKENNHLRKINSHMAKEKKELQAEIKELKYKLKHKAIKLHQDRIPKEYKKEAEEYFSHNPKSNKVWFYMLNEDDMENIDNLHCLGEDDAICTISND